MVGWHHWLNGCEFEWTLGVGDGQGGLVGCGSWVCKESDRTEQLNRTELTHQRMDRHNYYNVLLFSRKSKWSIDKCYNLEETWIHSEWKQSAIKHHILLLPGESQGQGSLVGCRLWGHTESDTTEATQQQQQHWWYDIICVKYIGQKKPRERELTGSCQLARVEKNENKE